MRCPTSAIAIMYGEHPAVEVVRRMLVAWLAVFPHMSQLRGRLRHAWRCAWMGHDCDLARIAVVQGHWSHLSPYRYHDTLRMAARFL